MESNILGVKVNFEYNIDSAVKKIFYFIKHSKSGLISTTNPYFIISAQSDREFKDIINRSLLSLPDGVGVLYAKYYIDKVSKYNRKNILFPAIAFFIGLYCGLTAYFDRNFGQTVTGVDLVYRLCGIAAKNGLTVFLLGGSMRDSRGNVVKSGIDLATDAANRLKKDVIPTLKIVGATSQFSREKSDDKITLSYIHRCMKDNNLDHIDILLVAYNPISQEKWISRNAYKIPATISIGVGRTYDYITNIMRPPNKVYDKLHIAWLYAFITQPWRIRRIFKTIIVFPWQIYLSIIQKVK